MTHRQERINELEEKIQIGKDLINFLKDRDQTEEIKNAKAFLDQEISICELSIMMVKEQVGWC